MMPLYYTVDNSGSSEKRTLKAEVDEQRYFMPCVISLPQRLKGYLKMMGHDAMNFGWIFVLPGTICPATVVNTEVRQIVAYMNSE